METYTIFQLKAQILAHEDALDQEMEREARPLAEHFPLEGVLYLGRQKRSIPPWVALLNPHLENPLPNVYTAGISAVLIVTYEQRLYAFTFGHGKSLLNPSCWVRNFGLKVTLNRINQDKLRSMDSRIYDDLVVSTRRQTSRSSTLDNFDVDINRTLLKGVTGDAEGEPAFTRLTGADGLRVTTPLPFAQVEDLLEEIVAAHEDDAYRDKFGWIDNIREVDQLETPPLDNLLVASIRDNPESEAYLAPPDTIEWLDIRGFNYTGGRPAVTYLELNIREYLAILQHRGIEIDLPMLKRHKVRVRNEADGELHDRWSVYDCLVWETMREHRRYVFYDGLWFEVDINYADRIAHFEEQITSDTILFPDSIAGEREEVYSARIATNEDRRYALLDQTDFRPEAAASPIEFCDLLSTNREIIHIKKRYASASLSHLFSQGAVSAELFLQDQILRDQIRQTLLDFQLPVHAALIPQDRPRPPEYEVVYAVIAGEDQRDWPPPLPFFSAVNLMHHATRLRNLGYKVSLQYIRLV